MNTCSTRQDMVDRQLRDAGIHDPGVLAAMASVPRDAFVPEALRDLAYAARPLRIDHGQTISQPYVVALMLEAARIRPADRVLEVGAGSGYAAAVMARLASHVHAIERITALADTARQALAATGCRNVEIIAGDGTEGWPPAAPFDVIIVSAGGPAIPAALRAQLAIGGRLVMPVGRDRHVQRLTRLVRMCGSAFQQDELGAVAFVPLIGAAGWSAPAPSI